jgi:hypothetical protein
MVKITMDGKYQTRGGRPVRVLCVDADCSQPVVAVVDGVPRTFKITGHWLDVNESTMDLIPVPEKRRVKFWVNVYAVGTQQTWTTKDAADSAAGDYRLACLEIDREFTVGEGL